MLNYIIEPTCSAWKTPLLNLPYDPSVCLPVGHFSTRCLERRAPSGWKIMAFISKDSSNYSSMVRKYMEILGLLYEILEKNMRSRETNGGNGKYHRVKKTITGLKHH